MLALLVLSMLLLLIIVIFFVVFPVEFGFVIVCVVDIADVIVENIL